MEIFNDKLESYINTLSENKRAKYTIKNDMYTNIVNVLKSTNTTNSPKFRFWVKETFNLVQIGSSDLVYVRKKKLPLITHENIYTTIDECHSAVGHAGRDKTWGEIKRCYAGIPQQAISIFISMCDVCQTRRSVPKPPSGKPIVSIGFLTRLQIDLIDMRNLEYEGYKFILHAKDHFTKFSWLYPLISKEASRVASHLRGLFYSFGPPRILQSDNGKEFVSNIILQLKLNWPDLIIINGRPRHPQSQGLVERGNGVVQKMLGKWKEINNTNDWPTALGPVMLSINNCVSQTTKKTPYEMVFGQPTRHNHQFWLELHKQYTKDLILNEEDLPDSISNLISFNDDQSTIASAISNDSDDFLLPSLSSLSTPEIMNNNITKTPHKRIRDEAEQHYIRAAEKQLKNYENASKKQKQYQINEIVGLKIPEVDRSNTAPSILPCKIVNIIYKDESQDIKYKLTTLNGVINNLFSSFDLIDLSETVSAELRQIDATKLNEITFIQACQAFTKFKSSDICKCTMSCKTNRCPCKRQSILCSSKCHRGKCISCTNVE